MQQHFQDIRIVVNFYSHFLYTVKFKQECYILAFFHNSILGIEYSDQPGLICKLICDINPLYEYIQSQLIVSFYNQTNKNNELLSFLLKLNFKH